MTASAPDHTPLDGAAVPPPGCPAHADALGPAGVTRLYGPAVESDPVGVYERLRAEYGPVAPVLLEGDVPAWLVLGYRENLEVARTPSRFTRDSRVWRDWLEGRIPADSPLVPMLGWRPDCVSTDGRDHQRLRAAVMESLERFDRRGIRRHIQRFANRLIDQFAGAGQAELLTQFAQQLPVLVLTHLLGLPEEDGPRLAEASTELIKGSEKAVLHNQYILDTLRQLVDRKRAAPGHDLASWLMAHPAALSDDEVQHHLRLVLIAANETTTNLIANTLRVVLTDRRFRASLAGGHMTLPDAVEQVLWDEPPLSVCPGRFATSDQDFAGWQVRAGDLLVLGLAAGNTDPQIRPDLAAPVHGNRSHLAFSGGPHECPGQDIGRAITDTGVDTLLARLPDIRLAVSEAELSWTASTWSRHLNALPVQFTARRPASPTGQDAGPRASVTPPREMPREMSGAGRSGGALVPVAPAPPARRRRGFLSRWLRRR